MRSLRDESVAIQYFVFKAFTMLKREADSIFRKHGLTGAQVGLLTRLSETHGKPMNQIGDELWCDVSNITGLVDRLEKQELVWRASDPADRRVSLIGITPKGVAALEGVLPEHEKALEARIGRLEPEERARLAAILTKLTS